MLELIERPVLDWRFPLPVEISRSRERWTDAIRIPDAENKEIDQRAMLLRGGTDTQICLSLAKFGTIIKDILL